MNQMLFKVTHQQNKIRSNLESRASKKRNVILTYTFTHYMYMSNSALIWTLNLIQNTLNRNREIMSRWKITIAIKLAKFLHKTKHQKQSKTANHYFLFPSLFLCFWISSSGCAHPFPIISSYFTFWWSCSDLRKTLLL